MKILWDPMKAEANQKKHFVSFEEAESVFYDFLSVTIEDPIHSDYEERFITIGMSSKNRLLVVVHTDNMEEIRIISSRFATKNERRLYEGNH